MKSKILLGTLLLSSFAAFALPSTAEVESAVKAGNYPQAETMMQEVVAAKPQSAKAHYIYAEILAHDAKFADAAAQSAQARQLDPSIKFTDPAEFRQFQELLQREQGRTAGAVSGLAPQSLAPAPAPMMQRSGGGLPGWVWGLGFAAIAFFVWRLVSRRAMANAMPSTAYGGGYGNGNGNGNGYGGSGMPINPMGPMGNPGGGLLRTGLAAAGGLAGGMLLEKYLEGREGEGQRNGFADQGVFDNGANQAASDLEQRPVDFGSGNDWGGDAPSSDNFTQSGDDGGW